jgi:dTDP-4-dehydrorhamnose reductase
MVTGAAGMLGTDVVQVLQESGEDVIPLSREQMDITDAQAVLRALVGADVVVNCAGWTAVDDAEVHENEAFAANALGAAHVARAAACAGARLIHISTDYVFSREGSQPCPEDAPMNPRSAYGRTKAAGEWAVRAESADALVLRTAWLYGMHGSCFPRTITRLVAERGAVRVVDDQIGQPTWTRDVAELALALARARAAAGTYHATSSGQVSWYGFAQAVLTDAGHDLSVLTPTTTAAMARPAIRPTWSVLGHGSLRAAGVAPIGPWHERWAAAAPAVLGTRRRLGRSAQTADGGS